MPNESIEIAKHTLMVFGFILAAGTIGAVISQKFGLPDVVFFLIAGTLLGPSVGGVIDVKVNSPINQLVLIFGSCYILFDGGTALRFKVLKEIWITVTALATIGVLITAVITAVAASYLLGIPFIIALLMAAAISATDPATMIPIFRHVKIKERLAQAVMSESALNDATGSILTLAVLAVAMGQGHISVTSTLLSLIEQASFGLIVGVIFGFLVAMLIGHARIGIFQEYAPLVSLMSVIAAYLSADDLRASGFMAVFAFGVMIGNKETWGFKMRRSQQESLNYFILTTSLILRMFIFILLGTQVDFALIGAHLVSSFVVIAVFMLIARPLTVLICAAPDSRAKWTGKELLFMCWTRETGVIPGALAGMLMGMGAPESRLIASVTFVAILMTILLQATTTHWLAKKLDLLAEK
jgi:cell volume regulation protein A